MNEILSLKWLISTVSRADCLINRHCASRTRPPIFSGLTDDSFSFPQSLGGYGSGSGRLTEIVLSGAEWTLHSLTYAQQRGLTVEKPVNFQDYLRVFQQKLSAVAGWSALSFAYCSAMQRKPVTSCDRRSIRLSLHDLESSHCLPLRR